jgi:small-conductance mechanosensitive channel
VKQKLLQAFSGLVDSVVAAAPKFVVGILLVIAGFIVAKLIEVVLRYMLTRVRFDRLMEKAGIDKALQRIGLRQQLNLFIPRLVYFLVLFVLAKTAADALGLVAISSAIGAFFSYLPNIIAALLLVILGTSLGQFAGEMVTESARSSGIDFAPSLGKLVSALIIFVVSMMAIAQLKIDTEIVRIVTSFILGGAALAFAISFGFGTRDVIRNITAGFYTRKFLRVGSRLEISGQQGILTGINATHAILQSEDHEISVANASFLDNIAKSWPPPE